MGSTRGPGIMVANPGYEPWLPMMAAGLARNGLLRDYVAPFAFRIDPLVAKESHIPLLRHIRSLLANRSLPDVVPRDAVHRRRSLLEAISIVAMRSGFAGRHVETLRMAYARAFATSVARMLRVGHVALVAPYGAALEPFDRARQLGIATFLDFPNAHYAYAQRLLSEEAELQPAFAETLQFHRFLPAQASRFEREMERADYIFVFSEFAKRSFEQAGVSLDKLVVTSLGVDTRLFRPRRTARTDGVFRVLFVGQITQRKGISYLLEAFQRAAIPRSELMLVGRVCGNDRAWRHFPGVRHESAVPRVLLPRFYTAADVFVMPSLVEGCCQTALEAMACGLPVIVSENTFSGVVTDGVDGHVVPIRDPDAIARHLVHLFENPERRASLGQAARARSLDFSWERYGDRVASLIEQRILDRC